MSELQINSNAPRVLETLAPAQAFFLNSKKKFVWFCAGRACGKCFGLGTEFLMYDLSVKKVEDIRVGDMLMGWDSKPREVVSLASGVDDMYEIKPLNEGFSPHTVNSKHILTLLGFTGNVFDIPLLDFDKSGVLFKLGMKNVSEFRVDYVGPGTYYGFTVNGDGRIVLADGTVTHNTHTGARYVYRKILTEPKAKGLICANTYDQLHSATLPPLYAYLNSMNLPFVVDKKPPAEWGLPMVLSSYRNVMTIKNGTHIFLRSLDNYDLIRGIEVGWAWIDEISSSTKEAWDVVIGCLRDKHGSLDIRVTGTPDGDNWTWREFSRKYKVGPDFTEEENEAAQLYDIVFMSTRDNPFISKEFVKGLLASYDPKKAKQEIDGRVVLDQSAATYYAFNPDLHRTLLVRYDPLKPLMLCIDFNASSVAPMCGVVCQLHKYADGVEFIQVLSEIEIYNGNTPLLMEAFTKQYRGHTGGVEIYGDTQGFYRGATTGVNDFLIAQQHLQKSFRNVSINVSKANYLEEDRIASVNSLLLNENGDVRMFINPDCKALLRDLTSVRYNAQGKLNKKNAELTHTSDAISYMIHYRFPIGQVKESYGGYNLDLMSR